MWGVAHGALWCDGVFLKQEELIGSALWSRHNHIRAVWTLFSLLLTGVRSGQINLYEMYLQNTPILMDGEILNRGELFHVTHPPPPPLSPPFHVSVLIFFFPHPSSTTTVLMCVCLCPFSSALCFLIRRLLGQSEVAFPWETGRIVAQRKSWVEEETGYTSLGLTVCFLLTDYTIKPHQIHITDHIPAHVFHIGPSAKGNRSWSDLRFSFVLLYWGGFVNNFSPACTIFSEKVIHVFLCRVFLVLTCSMGNTTQRCPHSFQCYCYIGTISINFLDMCKNMHIMNANMDRRLSYLCYKYAILVQMSL